MTKTSIGTSRTIPTSAFLPIKLCRPLKMFGRTFSVHKSTGITLSPDTVLRASLGMSLLQVLRLAKQSKNEGSKTYGEVLKDLMRGATGTNKLSNTTKIGVKAALSKFLPEEALSQMLDGQEPLQLSPSSSDWEALLIGLGPIGDDFLYQLVLRLAGLDSAVLQARGLPEREAMGILESRIGRPNEAWHKYNPALNLQVCFLIETSLQTLVWIEQRERPQSLRNDQRPDSQFLIFFAPGRKPIGHWLVGLQTDGGHSNLSELANFALRKGITFNGIQLSHDLLKKWSGGQHLMSFAAAKSVLSVLGSAGDFDLQCNRFGIARFMAFLCDLLIAGTQSDVPSWAEAQNQLFLRYAEIYEQVDAAAEAI